MGSIVARGNSYRAVVRRKGVTKTQHFRKKTLANKWIAMTEAAIDERQVTSKGFTLGSIILAYKKAVVDKKKYGVEKNGFHHIRLARDNMDQELDELNPERWVAIIQSWGDKEDPEHPGDPDRRICDLTKCSAQSRVRYLSLITSAMSWAEAKFELRLDWQSVKMGRKVAVQEGMLAKSKARIRRLQEGELAAIKKNLTGQLPAPEALSDIIDFTLELGFRISETCRITWKDLERKPKMLWVRDRKHPTEKIGNDYHVPLLGKALEIIERQPTEKLADGRIFPYKTDTVCSAFRRATKAAGIVGLKEHDLRHEGISRLFEPLYDKKGKLIRGGYSIPEVALVSGHRNWANLKIYTNLKPASLHTGPASRATIGDA
jgi:integrase